MVDDLVQVGDWRTVLTPTHLCFRFFIIFGLDKTSFGAVVELESYLVGIMV